MGAQARTVTVLSDENDDGFRRRLVDRLTVAGAHLVADAEHADVAILVASPASAANAALSADVVDFVRRHSEDELIIVVIEGMLQWRGATESDSALSPELAGALSLEPLWLDARTDGGASRTLRRLAATLAPPPPPPAAPPQPSGSPAPPQHAAQQHRSEPAGGTEASRGTAVQPSLARRSWAAIAAAVIVLAALFAVGVLLLTPGDSIGEADSSSAIALLAVGAALVACGAGVTSLVRSRRKHHRDERVATAGRGRQVRPQPRSTPAAASPSSPRPGFSEPRRPVVFVSHDHADADLVDSLAEGLRPELEAWVSRSAIDPGDSWVFEISDALEQSDAFVAVLTDEALESAWVRRELSAALLLHERNGRPRFFPVKVRPCTLPVLLETFQVIDATTGNVDSASHRLKRSILAR